MSVEGATPSDRVAHGYAERVLEGVLVLAAASIPLAEGATQIACALALLLIVTLRGRAILPRSRRVRLFFVFFGGWLVLGAVSAALSGSAVRTSSLNYALMSFALVVGIELALFSDRERLKRLAWALLIGASIAAILAISQLALGEFPGESLLSGERIRGQRYIPGTRDLAATGTLQHRLKMSEAWLAVLALCCALRISGLNALRSVAFGGAVLALLALTYAKAAFGAAWIALGAWVALRYAPKLTRAGYALGAAVLLAAVPVALWLGARTTPRLPVPQGSLEVRPWLWSLAYDLFVEAPRLGSGIGTYYGRARPRVISQYDVHSFGAHQELVTVAVETGVVGLLLFFAAVVTGGVCLLRAEQEAREPGARALMNFALVCFTAYAVLALVHDFLFNPTTALVFWTSVGVGLGAVERLNRAQRSSMGFTLRSPGPS